MSVCRPPLSATVSPFPCCADGDASRGPSSPGQTPSRHHHGKRTLGLGEGGGQHVAAALVLFLMLCALWSQDMLDEIDAPSTPMSTRKHKREMERLQNQLVATMSELSEVRGERRRAWSGPKQCAPHAALRY